MTTFEDAAEELVVKLRGLDSEIEESEQKLEELRGRIEEVAADVEKEWGGFSDALESFLQGVGDEQDQLDQLAQTALQGLTDTHQAVVEDGATARTEIAEGRARLDALGEHALAMEPGVTGLAGEAGEEPARGLAARARELEQQLGALVEEARDFLNDDVVPGIEEAASDIRDRCQELRTNMAETAVPALQAAFDDWESKLDELEDYVSSQGFVASHAHALAVVEYALEECRTASQAHLDHLDAAVQAALEPLTDLAADVERSGGALDQAAGRLVAELDEALGTAKDALSALDGTRDVLAAYSFVSV